MSNEQIRYILDNANDFLEDVDEDWVPEKDKPNFEDWNPPEGGTFGEVLKSLDDLIGKMTVQAKIPSVTIPPKGLHPDAAKVWSDLMSAPGLVTALRRYSWRQQWSLARYFLVKQALAQGVCPFNGWTQANTDAFAGAHKRLAGITK